MCSSYPKSVECSVRSQVAPIAVYTSGKGSSAAGLTASVQRDPVSVCRVLALAAFLLIVRYSARVLSRRRGYGSC